MDGFGSKMKLNFLYNSFIRHYTNMNYHVHIKVSVYMCMILDFVVFDTYPMKKTCELVYRSHTTEMFS